MTEPEHREKGKGIKGLVETGKRPEILIAFAILIVGFLTYRRMKASSSVSDRALDSPQNTGGNPGAGTGSLNPDWLPQFNNQLSGMQAQFAALQGQQASDIAALTASQEAAEAANTGAFAGIMAQLAALSAKIAALGANSPVTAPQTPQNTPAVGQNPAPSYSPPSYVQTPSQLRDMVYGVDFANRYEDTDQPWAPTRVSPQSIHAPAGGVLASGVWHGDILTKGTYIMPDGSRRRVGY